MRILKTTIVAALAGTMMASAALAADLLEPVTTPDAAVDWNGMYVGVGISGAYNPAIPESLAFGDFIVGANMQSDNFVFGGEAVLSGYVSDFPDQGWSASGEVRAGMLVAPDTLLYGSLGAIHFGAGANYVQVGGGVEFMVSDQMSLDLEGKYWDQVGGGYNLYSGSASVLWHIN